MTTREAAMPRGVWLTPGPVRTRIETLLLELVKPHQPDSVLRQSVVEELGRPVKRTDVVLQYLGLTMVGLDSEGEVPLIVVAPKPGRDPWREALLVPGGECGIGVVVNTCDRGLVALIHEVFGRFSAPQKDLVRRYAALVARESRDERIVESLSEGPDGARRFAGLLAGARREVQLLDSSILVSPDGRIRAQLGSLSDTTRNLLREGIQGEQVFVLPPTLFGKAPERRSDDRHRFGPRIPRVRREGPAPHRTRLRARGSRHAIVGQSGGTRDDRGRN